jgi:hypothetical protein
MTKNKCIRLIKDLVEKYGDVDIAYLYDYYASRLIKPDGTYADDVVVGTIKLSDATEIVTCRSDYDLIVKIVEGKIEPQRQYVVVPESKEKYDSKEQEAARAQHRRGLNAFLASSSLFHNYESISRIYDASTLMKPHTTPKEFGMAMDNCRKRKKKQK